MHKAGCEMSVADEEEKGPEVDLARGTVAYGHPSIPFLKWNSGR